MPLHARQKCTNGNHLMSGLRCVRCGEFISPFKNKPTRDIQEEVNDVCQSSTNAPKE